MGWCHTAATKLMHKYLQKEAVGRVRPTQKCNQTNATRNEHKIHDIHNIYLNDLTLRLTRSANVKNIFWKSISISCWIHWHSFTRRVSVSLSIRTWTLSNRLFTRTRARTWIQQISILRSLLYVSVIRIPSIYSHLHDDPEPPNIENAKRNHIEKHNVSAN